MPQYIAHRAMRRGMKRRLKRCFFRFAGNKKMAGAGCILVKSCEAGLPGSDFARLNFHFAEREPSLVLVVDVAVSLCLSQHGFESL